MREVGGRNLIPEGPVRILAFVGAGLLGVCLLVYVLLEIYLATPLPARQISRLVTSALNQPFTVQSVSLSGRTLVLRRVRLMNPKGFAGPDLVAADTVAVKPHWLALLRGRRRFDLIGIDGGSINLLKNGSSAWNFSELQRRLAARKPAKPAPETVIAKLLVRKGALTVQGEGVHGLDLKLYNLTSGGSRNAQVELAFEDAGQNRYQLQGTARPGDQAAVDLTLSAPILSLGKVAALLKLKNPQPLDKAGGSLTVNAVLAKGELRSSGTFRFRDVLLPAARGSYPIAGTLQFNGSYILGEDRADLNEATLAIENVAQLHAEGSLTGVRKERRYALLFGVDQVDLALLNVLLTDEARRSLLLAGKLRCESLRLEGTGAGGVESAAGNLLLQDGSLSRKGELLVAGLSGQAALSRKGTGVAAVGTLSAAHGAGGAAIDALRLPFDVALSSRLKPVMMHSRGFSVRAFGIPVDGDLSYDLQRPEPLSATLRIAQTKLASLNPFLKRYNLQASTGTGAGTVALTGKRAQDLKLSGRIAVVDFSGTRGKEPIAIKDGAVSIEAWQQGGHRQASGEARLTGLTLASQHGDARFGYRVEDDKVTLDGVQARLGTARLVANRIAGRLPPPGTAAGRTPLLLELEGGALRQGDLELSGLSGRVRGSVVTAGTEKWLEGAAELSCRAVTMKSRPVGGAVLQANFAKAGGRAELTGSLLGGKLAAEASLRPFAPDAAVSFKASLQEGSAGQLAPFLPQTATIRPTGGYLELRCSGTYSGKKGLECRFDTKGRSMALAKNGKNTLSGASSFLSGSYSAGTLSIGEGLFSPGKGVALRARGQVAAAFSPKRRGTISLSLPDTPIDALVDATVNLMPTAIQEATLKGAITASGNLEFRDGRQLLEGRIDVQGGSVESAPQKLTVTGVEGRIPVSLDLSGKSAPQPTESREFSRANYPRLLGQLRTVPTAGEQLTVGKIVFGTLELGKLTLQLRASQGLMEIAPLRTTLYDGAVIGTGYLAVREKPTYRVDLLVNGLSLKQLCRSIPGVQGYISGRVDGVISFKGVGGGVAGTTGFVDLWAREGGGEKMLVSKEFLQRLAKQKLSGFFLSRDRDYDEAEIKATLQEGDLTFNTLKIVNTNFFGVKDLNVNIAPTQNRIALDHLLESIKEAAVRGKPATGEPPAGKVPAKSEPVPEFKWEE
ncbi:AsmA family protein [Geomonas azotofigens]|uniref:AsmA family protein n=1 Tax=Geomonas azotofigens TaxID=2843196 RepID=UPI001C105B01|nr:AsmA family protein [Geomonas azotofigens]MBU5611531.1 AsmA family protein [Geomonas azotofigens]